MPLRLGKMFWRGMSLAAFGIVVDQISKWWILTEVMQPPQVIPVTPFFNLVMTWNRGVSFGLFNSGGSAGVWILSGLAVVIVLFLAQWLRRVERLSLALAIGAIIGGALGNVIDRMRFGAVADFLDVHILGYHWPAFNVADSLIFLGAVYLIVDSLFSGKESTEPAENR